MSLDQIIRAVQAKLGLTIDGKPGPQTWDAIHKAILGSPPPPLSTTLPQGAVDPRSEACIATLHDRVKPYARALVTRAAAAGIVIKIISALRTFDAQNALYAQGRSKPGSKVTNAPGGYSNHNFGLAFDIGVFDGTKYIPESPRYKAVAAIGLDLGLEWGGSWKTIKDEPHYQLRPSWAASMSESVMLAELRRRKSTVRDFFA